MEFTVRKLELTAGQDQEYEITTYAARKNKDGVDVLVEDSKYNVTIAQINSDLTAIQQILSAVEQS